MWKSSVLALFRHCVDSRGLDVEVIGAGTAWISGVPMWKSSVLAQTGSVMRDGTSLKCAVHRPL